MEIKIGKRRGFKNIQQTKQRSPITDTHSINTNIFIYLSAHLSTYLSIYFRPVPYGHAHHSSLPRRIFAFRRKMSRRRRWLASPTQVLASSSFHVAFSSLVSQGRHVSGFSVCLPASLSVCLYLYPFLSPFCSCTCTSTSFSFSLHPCLSLSLSPLFFLSSFYPFLPVSPSRLGRHSVAQRRVFPVRALTSPSVRP